MQRDEQGACELFLSLGGGTAGRLHDAGHRIHRPEWLVYDANTAKYATIVHPTTGKHRLYYETYGTGKKPVLFLMGLAASHAQNQIWIEEFGIRRGDEFTVLVLDNRGVGFSDTPFSLLKNIWRWKTSDMAADVLQLLVQLACHDTKWNQEVNLVGFSMGGMIALELVLLDPKRFGSLTLMNTHAGGILGTVPPLTGKSFSSYLT